VTELPPDPARLNAILRYLDEQITDHDAVETYLRLQRDAVRRALGETGRPPAPKPPPHPANSHRPTAPPFAPTSRERQSTGFAVDRQPRAVGTEPARIHVDDCPSAVNPRPINSQEARAALLDPSVAACPFCRPDSELGMDID
jgi:hypothetical protein